MTEFILAFLLSLMPHHTNPTIIHNGGTQITIMDDIGGETEPIPPTPPPPPADQ